MKPRPTQHIRFVINPISGINRKEGIIHSIPKTIDPARFSYDVVLTQAPGHATQIAREAANSGVDIVCAVGGDGTVNEVARALLHTGSALAIIPTGSGNGLARHLHVPLVPQSALKFLNNTPAHHIDYGLVNAHPFFCTCGVGFDAFISQKFSEARKRGFLTYLENVLRYALTYNSETYSLDIEDQEGTHYALSALIIACGNACQYGNNIFIAPGASVRDGLLDVTVIQPFNALQAPQIAAQLLFGQQQNGGCIRTLRCRHLTITRKQRGIIHFDGEPIEADPTLDISLVHRGLRCICPTDEGIPSPARRVENAVVETISHINMRAEELLANIKNGWT